MAEAHALTVRLPDSVYKTAKRLALSQNVSMNALVTTAIVEKARRAAVKQLAAAYDALAEDGESSAEEFFSAQVEALLDE